MQGRPASTVDYISSELRTEIAAGALVGGDRLALGAVANRFGTSVIPVREALRILAAEGLVVMRPHRSAVVADLPLGDLDDLYHVRLLLESEAVRLAKSVDAADRTRLAFLIDEMGRALTEGAYARAFETHKDIHFSVYRLCGSSVLLDSIERVWGKSERYRLASMPVREDASDVAVEHWEFVDPLCDGRTEDAIVALRAHLMRTRDSLHVARAIEELSAQGSEAQPSGTRSASTTGSG